MSAGQSWWGVFAVLLGRGLRRSLKDSKPLSGTNPEMLSLFWWSSYSGKLVPTLMGKLSKWELSKKWSKASSSWPVNRLCTDWRGQRVFITELITKLINKTAEDNYCSLFFNIITFLLCHMTPLWSHLGFWIKSLNSMCRLLLISDSEVSLLPSGPGEVSFTTAKGLSRYLSTLHKDSTVCFGNNSTGRT